MGLTKDISNYIYQMEFERMPESVIPIIKNAFIDTIGVAIAGKDEDSSRIMRKFVASEKAKPSSVIWGCAEKTSSVYAALVNGTMAHALDYDDVNSIATLSHPSASLVPAIMAVAQEIDATGRDIVLAYFIGFEVMAYIGRTIGQKHYDKGWHGTATIGVLGCTAAAGKLYGLTSEQLQHAFGIAVSQCSGSRQNFGTMTKPFHPGHAARSGIVAAKLASESFTADTNILEAPMGFFHLYGNPDECHPQPPLGSDVELLRTGISVKRYPCCYATHRSIDALFKLIDKYDIKPDQIEQITACVPRNGFQPLIYTRPKTGLQGKFSIEYVLAAVAIDGKINLDTFTDEQVNRPEIQAFMPKVKRAESPSIKVDISAVEEGYVEVTVRLIDGQEHTEKIEYPKGAPQWPLTQEELFDKFSDCLKKTFDSNHTAALFDSLIQMDQLDSMEKVFKLL